jgi:hypothetical protein
MLRLVVAVSCSLGTCIAEYTAEEKFTLLVHYTAPINEDEYNDFDVSEQQPNPTLDSDLISIKSF